MATTPRSVSINGRTVTDPAQVDRITRNREAAATYAVQDNARDGTPIPTHLQGTNTVQNALRGGSGGGGGTGSFGLPDPMSGRVNSVFGVNVGGSGGRGGTGSFGLPDPMAGRINSVFGVNVGGSGGGSRGSVVGSSAGSSSGGGSAPAASTPAATPATPAADVPAAAGRVYVPPPPGYRPGIDPEHQYFQSNAARAPARSGLGGLQYP
jgi:hypothetical protein